MKTNKLNLRSIRMIRMKKALRGASPDSNAYAVSNVSVIGKKPPSGVAPDWP